MNIEVSELIMMLFVPNNKNAQSYSLLNPL